MNFEQLYQLYRDALRRWHINDELGYIRAANRELERANHIYTHIKACFPTELAEKQKEVIP